MWRRLLVNRWSDMPKLLGLALVYTLLAKFMLDYLPTNGIVSIMWPPSGLALAALLVWGRKYWPGIFIGSYAGHLLVNGSLDVPTAIACGNTLGALLAVTFLRGKRFNLNLTHPRDFLWLGLASAASAAISAIVGVATLWLAGTVLQQTAAANALYWWQGETLGMMLFTPLLLVWRHLPEGWFKPGRIAETVIYFCLVFLAGQIVFLGWFHGFFGMTARGFWMFVFVVWGAVRFGRHGASLILCMTAFQMLMGTVLQSSGFASNLFPTGTVNFWFYMVALTITGVTLSLVIEGRRLAEDSLTESYDLLDKLSHRVPGVIYQFEMFPDGRSCFPFASEAIQDIFEVTPEQVREDASDVFAMLHPEDYDGIVTSIDESARNLTLWRQEFRMMLPRQGVCWRLGESQPQRLEDGSVLWHGFITDITERKKSEQRIERLTHLYKALSEVNQAIVRMEQQTELFPLVCRCAVEFGGLRLAWVGQLDNASGLIIPVASHGEGQGYLQDIVISSHANVPEGQGPTGSAFRENHAVIINDYNADSRTLPWQEKAAQFGWNAAATFPIQRGRMPFAVLSVYHEQSYAFDDEMVALLQEMSSDVSFALDNFDREIVRKNDEESLLLAASVYDTSSEAMIITDAQDIVITVNPAFSKITGYEPEDIVGKHADILKSDRHDETFYQELWQEVETTGRWQGERWDKRKNGDDFAIWLTINNIFNADDSVHRRVSLFSDITDWKKSQELIWHQANYDPLTRLPNRQMFQDRMYQEIKKSHRAGLPLALLFLDLDRFKEVNDTLGHDMGDVLLKEAASRITHCVRETDTVARLGGDEFTIILGELDDRSNVDRVAEDILRKLSSPFQLGSEMAYISASIGITLYPEDATTADVLLKNADQAMYAAKNQGRNGYHYFTQSMQQAAQARLRLMKDLRKALAGQQFHVYYQPIVVLESGDIHKAEALVRWEHPKRGLIGPAEFIPLAEESGLIIDIGEWVFRQAVAQAAIWRKSHHAEFQISVNKSPVQFHNEDKTYASWPIQLDEMKLVGQCIVVEITEGLLLDTGTRVMESLEEFRKAGIQVSLDDFGTGYSSLSYLNKFNIDYLKIDQSFVRDLSAGSSNMALCEAIIVMAHKLGMKVIAEGIETRQQHDLLVAAGCDYGQGYLFSRPVPVEQFEALLKKT